MIVMDFLAIAHGSAEKPRWKNYFLSTGGGAP